MGAFAITRLYESPSGISQECVLQDPAVQHLRVTLSRPPASRIDRIACCLRRLLLDAHCLFCLSKKIRISYNNFEIDPLNRYFSAKNGTENGRIIPPPVWECPPRGRWRREDQGATSRGSWKTDETIRGIASTQIGRELETLGSKELTNTGPRRLKR